MFTPTSGGTGTWTVSAAVTGYMTPAQAGAVNATTYYYGAENSTKTEWEIGLGTYTVSGTTLARTTVLYSSNSNAAVNFTNPPNVFVTLLAENKATPNEYGLLKPYEAMGSSVPLSASFTWVNQGDASVADGTGALIFTAPLNASTNTRILVLTPPGTPYSVYMRANIDATTVSSTTQFGMVLRNSTSGRFLFHSVYNLVNNSPNRAWQSWSSATAFNGTTSSATMWNMPPWFKADVTSTTATPYISYDGWNWSAAGTAVTLSAYLTATGGTLDQIGFGYQCQNGPAVITVYVFQTAAPT